MSLIQDKELHAPASPAAGPAGVQAQRRDEGVFGKRPAAPHPHRAPPVSAGPQVAEGPAGGAALRPQAGRGQGGHQGLCQIYRQTTEGHRGQQCQVTGRGGGSSGGSSGGGGGSVLKVVTRHSVETQVVTVQGTSHKGKMQ